MGRNIKIVLAFSAIYIIWGSYFAALKLSVETLPPYSSSAVRYLASALILIGLARMRGSRLPSAGDVLRGFWLGIWMMFLPDVLAMITTLQGVSTGLATVVSASIPLWTILLLPVLRGAPLKGLPVALIGFAGILMLTSSGGSGISAGHLVLLALSAVSWVYGSCSRARENCRVDVFTEAALEYACAAALMAAVGLIRKESFAGLDLGASGVAIAASVYRIVMVSVVAYVSYLWLLSQVDEGKVATFAYVNPVIGLAIGFLLFGERLGGVAMIGCLVVTAAVALTITDPQSLLDRVRSPRI